MEPKKLKIDRVKEIKRNSRLDNKIAGKGGFHKDKREKRQHKMSTLDYIEEYKKDLEDDLFEETDDLFEEVESEEE
jgi:hypothetical protein